MMKSKLFWGLMITTGALLGGCGDDDGGETTTASTTTGVGGSGASGGSSGSATGGSGGGDDCESGTGGEVPTTYSFDSRFTPGTSPVSYSGQSMRQLLVMELKADIAAITGEIDGDTFSPANTAAVMDRLNFFYETVNAGDCDTQAIEYTSTDPALLQTKYGEISCKNLKGKFAGNDDVTDHKDWDAASNFKGWSNWDLLEGEDTNTPEGLLQAFFATIAKQAYDRENGTTPCEPGTSGATCVQLPVHITETGLDLQQLVQKFLTGALAYSQGTDDYLDSDVAGKGLMSSNAQDEDKAYSKLGHAWDEGFGYFGAARDYADYTDDEIAGKADGAGDRKAYHDTDRDGKIDFKSEYNLGVSVNAAKRDRGSKSTTPTDLTKQAFDAFLAGRNVILSACDTLTDDEMNTLKGHRDQIVDAWEKALAATVIHYVNDVLADMDKMGTADYVYADHVKHWGELKGFALGLQFNPHGKTLTVFEDFHTKVGDQPVLETASTTDRDAYKTALTEARDALGTALSFTTDQVEGW